MRPIECERAFSREHRRSFVPRVVSSTTMNEGRFSPAAADQILRRAAEIEENHPDAIGASTGLSVVEIEHIAGESAIQPASVRRAIAELAETRETSPFLLGAAYRVHFQYAVRRELKDEEIDALLAEFQRAVSRAGRITRTQNSVSFFSFGASSTRLLVTRARGETTLSIEGRHGGLVGAIFGGVGGGVAGGIGAPIAAIVGVTTGSGLLGLATAFVGLAGAWLLARSFFSRAVERHQRVLKAAFARLVDLMEEPAP